MKRELTIALAIGAAIALAIPSMIASLEPSLDAEIRVVLSDLHAARSLGGRAHGIAFSPEGRPIAKAEIERRDYIIAIDADGRVSVRIR